MVYVRIICYLITLIPFLQAADLPILATSQDTYTIRFISNDGKFTYYQRRSGDLLLSTNYSVQSVLEGKSGTQYEIITGRTSEYLLVVKKEMIHSFLNPTFKNPIYIVKAGEKESKMLGSGINPQFQQDDNWISYIDPDSNSIEYVNIKDNAITFTIKLQQSISPFFIPYTTMLSDGNILYTDNNLKGEVALLASDRKINKTSLIYKLENGISKIELCTNAAGATYMFLSHSSNSNKMSQILLLDSSWPPSVDKSTIMYEGKELDVGNLVCQLDNNKLFFIQSFIESEDKLTDIVELDLTTKQIKRISNLKFASNIIVLGNRLLTMFNGKNYILLGENNAKDQSVLPKEEKKEEAQEKQNDSNPKTEKQDEL